MEATHPTRETSAPWTFDAATMLYAVRSFVGAFTWLSPRASWRAFGLGTFDGNPGTAFVGRLFGVRDLALGQAVRHPDPAVQRAALQIGVAVDAVDVTASLIALGKGAPKAGVLIGGGGAAVFVALGVLALRDRPAG